MFRKLLLLALMSMMALAVFAPAAMADAVVGDNDNQYSDDSVSSTATATQYSDDSVSSTATATQYDDSAVNGDDQNGDDSDTDSLPSTGGPALLPLVGLLALGVGALGLVSTKLRRN